MSTEKVNRELDEWIDYFHDNVQFCDVVLDGLDCLELVWLLSELKERRQKDGV